MIFQPLVYFTAIIWVAGFLAFGLYVAFKRGAAPVSERLIGLMASLLVGAIGAGAMIAGLYILEELI
ncbi:MAG: hypothetical protein JOY77_11595 [Alphaproteobacteria bacterium]|nr:hypothetical protein [Alphaproteobacteria bacterium]MBV9063553.1 hypothetical protein [Alphaproteobacteria bacterium]